MQLVTPASRAKISHAVTSEPRHVWTGIRKGVHMRIALNQQPTLENHRIVWTAIHNHNKHTGTAGTVWDAIAEIEREVARERTI